MKYRTRIYYTEEQKALMWDRWQKGDFRPKTDAHYRRTTSHPRPDGLNIGSETILD